MIKYTDWCHSSYPELFVVGLKRAAPAVQDLVGYNKPDLDQSRRPKCPANGDEKGKNR